VVPEVSPRRRRSRPGAHAQRFRRGAGRETRRHPGQLELALDRRRACGVTLGRALVDLGFLDDEQGAFLLSCRYAAPLVNLGRFEIDPSIIKIISAETAHKYQVLPLSRHCATLWLATADPAGAAAMGDVKFMTGYNVEPVVASESQLTGRIRYYYGKARGVAEPGPDVESDTRTAISILSDYGDAPLADQLLWLIMVDSRAWGRPSCRSRRGATGVGSPTG